MFRYTHNPNIIWWLVYLGYWVFVCLLLAYRGYKGTLYSKDGLSPVLGDFDSGDDVESGTDSQSSSLPKVSLNRFQFVYLCIHGSELFAHISVVRVLV